MRMELEKVGLGGSWSMLVGLERLWVGIVGWALELELELELEKGWLGRKWSLKRSKVKLGWR